MLTDLPCADFDVRDLFVGRPAFGPPPSLLYIVVISLDLSSVFGCASIFFTSI